MGICSAKQQRKPEIIEQNEISSKQTCQQDQNQDVQKMIKSEKAIKTKIQDAQTPNKSQLKNAASPSTKIPKRMVWADQIIENSNNFRGTLKTFISIKNIQFTKYYSILNKEQSQCRIKLNEQMVLVQHNLSGNIRVAELIKKSNENQQLVEEIIKSQLIHPNLIRIFDIFQDNTNYQIIHDFCNGGTLQQFLSVAVYTQPQAAITLKQIIDVIQYIHQYGYFHGSLTLQSFQKCNQSTSCFIKLTDFKHIYLKQNNISKDSMYYLAPEAIKIPDLYTEERDVWSIGIILYRMLSGQFPFHGETTDDIYNSISKYAQSDNFDTECLPPQSIKLIKQFLRVNPKERIKLNQSLNNDFLRNNLQQSQQELDTIVKQLESNNNLTFLQCCFLQFMISTFRQDQEQHLYQIFRQFDQNHDGKLSKQELTQAYLNYFSNIQEVKDHVDAVFKGINLNKSGKLDFQEFLIGVIDKNQLITKDNLNEAFKMLSDIEGHITLQKMSHLYVNKKQALKQSFQKYENNQITQKQFEDLMFDAL